MSVFEQYPYTNFHNLNLDYLIRRINEIADELSKFIELNTIKYADPIAWDINRSYEANTVVVDNYDGTAYLSTGAVSAGTSISNTEYWTPIYNYTADTNLIRSNIAQNDKMSDTSTSYLASGALVWYKGNLYRTQHIINIGDKFVPGSNIKAITIEAVINEGLSRITELEKYPIYAAADENLIFLGTLQDTSGTITSSGDTHVYTSSDETMSIVKD